MPPRADRSRARDVMTVVLADDDAAVRQALAALLSEDSGFVLLAQAADGQEALAVTAELAADVVVVDVRMPHGGPQLVRALRSLEHRPVVVGLSANADSRTWARVVGAGAAGYLLKSAVGPDFASLLRRCARGELIVTVPGAAERVRRLLVAGP